MKYFKQFIDEGALAEITRAELASHYDSLEASHGLTGKPKGPVPPEFREKEPVAGRLPAGPIKVVWQTGVKSGQKTVDAWVVQLPKAPGFSYFAAPSGRDSKSGLNALRKAVLSGVEMAKYKKRVLIIGATESLVKQAMGKDVQILTGLVGIKYTAGPKTVVETALPTPESLGYAVLRSNSRNHLEYWTGKGFSPKESEARRLTRQEAEKEAKAHGLVVAQLDKETSQTIGQWADKKTCAAYGHMPGNPCSRCGAKKTV